MSNLTESDLERDEIALIRRVYEQMWNAANPAAAYELFAQPQSVAEFVHGFLVAFPGLQHTIEEVLVRDHRVVVRFSARGLHSGPWMNFQATGKQIMYTGVMLARAADGKIVDHQTWWDTWGLIQQIKAG